MLGWVYILIRTYPFWALPLGLAILTGWHASRRYKHRKGRSVLWAFGGVCLMLSSVAFLYFQGHFKAVPFVYELIRGPAALP